MLDYKEQRDYPRMELDCPASFSFMGQPGTQGAIVKNLSGGGVLMWIEGQVTPGSNLDIEVAPPNSRTPPMHARMQVLRCTPVDGADGQFAVACVLQESFGYRNIWSLAFGGLTIISNT